MTRTRGRRLAPAVLAAGLLGAGCEQQTSVPVDETLDARSARETAAPLPVVVADGSWIHLEGVVGNVDRNRFRLDYAGAGSIVVEMDDGDRDADADVLREGDRVAVSGRIDDDLFERRTIEAGSVFVERLDTWFHSSTVDDESRPPVAIEADPLTASRAVVDGTVTETGDGRFTVSMGEFTFEVDVGRLEYDPLDDEGYQQVNVGDRVRVVGPITDSILDDREIHATRVTTLRASPPP